MKIKLLTTVIAAVLILGLGTAVFAQSQPIKIFLNGQEIKSDISPINVKGRIIAPVRAISEALGATVSWDQTSNQIHIESDKEDGKQQIISLEQALAPVDQLDAVKKWAEGVKTRNGALQYAVMSPEMKKENYDDFAAFNWSTGTSSPWVKAYDIKEISKTEQDTYRYEVTFSWTDSTNSTSESTSVILVSNIEGKWLVSAIEIVDVKGEITKLTLGKDQKIESIFVEGSKESAIYDKATVIIGEGTKIYQGYTNLELDTSVLVKGTKVEVTFVDGPMLMIYPPSAEAEVIRVL